MISKPASWYAAIGGLEARELGDAGGAPGCPEINEYVFPAVRGEADRVAADIGGGECRRRLADGVEPLELGLNFLAEVGVVVEASEEGVVDLAGGGDVAGGHGGGGEILGEADGEFFLVVLAEALHQLTESDESEVELAGMGAGHRLDDLGQRLDRAVRIGLQVGSRQAVDIVEPVVLDGLVEECGVGLIAVDGLGVFLDVGRQLADECPVVAGLDFGNTRAGRRLGMSRVMDQGERGERDGGHVICSFHGDVPRSQLRRVRIFRDSGDGQGRRRGRARTRAADTRAVCRKADPA